MEYISIKQAIQQSSGKVKIRGWCYRERGSNALRFIVMRDSTEIIQCVFDKEKISEEIWEDCQKIKMEASFEVTGELVKNDKAPTGFEVQVDDLKIIGLSENYPISKDFSTEFLLDQRHLWLRSRRLTAILKIRSTVFQAIDEYFKAEEFYEYHSPTLQSVQCEGGSTLFDVDFFGKKGVFLAQTWQLYAEPAIFALEKIYTIAPSFRAEKSKTSRHLCEYWHAEMEMAWSTFEDIQDHGEKLIKYVMKKVLEKHLDDLKLLKRDIEKLKPIVEKPFVRMTYTDALKILKEKFDMDIEWGKDLRTIEEDKLSSLYDVPIICTHYPMEVKAFYMMQSTDDERTVLGVDFIAPEGYGELIGGSQREHDIEKIKKRLLDTGETIEEYEFYLDTRQYGSVPHGGFGLGVERLISWICGLDNIKDAIPFPRTMLRWKP
jgi:asparaginyl-tRNA synthetase